MSAGSPIVKYGSIAAGYVASNKVNELVDKLTGGKIDSKIVNGVMAAAGLYYLFISKGKKNTIVTVAAGLAAGTGVKGLLSDFGVMNGFNSIPVIGGYTDVPVIGGYNVPQPSLSGVGGYNVPSVMGGIGGITIDESGSGINETDK